MKNLRLFQTAAEYSAATLEYPSTSLIKDTGDVVSKIDSTNYIDLGLSSGTLWADRNVGAASETDYGLYFQFGDTIGYTGDEAKAHSTWATCPGNGGNTSFNSDSINAWDVANATNGILKNSVDAAYVHTFGRAKTPNATQLYELTTGTTMEWTTINGVNGYKFTNKTDASKYIFIPAAGYFYNRSQLVPGTSGNIWAKSFYAKAPQYAFEFYFSSSSKSYSVQPRLNAFTIRGVI